MGTKLKKAVFALIFLTSAVPISPVLAETVTTSDLGVENTGILPSNPFYFFKEWGRGLRRTLSLGDLKKAQLALEFLNERAAEIRKLEEITPENISAFSRAVVSYRSGALELKEKLRLLRGNSAAARLVDPLLDKALKHQDILVSLFNKFGGAESAEGFYSSIDSALSALAEVVAAIPGNLADPKKFRESFEAAVSAGKNEAKELTAAELADRLEEVASPEHRPDILKLKENLFLKLIGKLQSGMASGDGLDISSFRQAADPLRRIKILDEIREKIADPELKNQINIERQNLLDEVKEKKLIRQNDVEAAIKESEARYEDAMNRLSSRSGEVRRSASEFLERARFNLDAADKFSEQAAYANAYGQAVSASALLKNAFSILDSNRSDYGDDINSLKSAFDSSAAKAKTLKLTPEKNPEIFDKFGVAEKQIAKLSDSLQTKTSDSVVSSGVKDLKLTLAAIEQTLQSTETETPGQIFGVEAAQKKPAASEMHVAAPAVETVLIKNEQFVPSVLRVKKGTKVQWVNEDSDPHWIESAVRENTGMLKDLDSQKGLERGERYSYVFDKTGTWKYRDRLDPGMVGVIVAE